MPILTVENLKKSFIKNNVVHTVLKNISFNVDRGQIITLLGSSGSGKSTLLRCINQLETPDAGKIEIDKTLWDFSAKSQKQPSHKKLLQLRTTVGMVFQQFNLWPHMTVLDNLIEAPCKVLKIAKDQAITEAEALLERVNLLHKKLARPAQLSGGEQQRVAILRAVMTNPKIILFDEPVSALDPEMVGEVVQVMQKLVKEGNMSLIVATHLVHFAHAIADRAIFLEQGEILEEGAADTLFNNPKTKRLKQFLDSSSLV